MNCDVCGKVINEKKVHAHVWLNKQRYSACKECNEDGAFAKFIDDYWDEVTSAIQYVDKTD